MIDLIFVISQTNRNSFAALCGALDKYELFDRSFNLKLVNEEEVQKKQAFKEKAIFCFSFQTSDVFRVKQMITKIKERNKKAILLAGGSHSSGDYTHALKMGFDYVFVGEGEESFVAFLKEYVSGKRELEKIQGIFFKRNGKKFFTGKAGFVEMDNYLPVSSRFRFFTPIEITRGCPHGCYFCQTTYLFGKIRHHSIDKIVGSAKILVNHGWNSIRFISPNILSYGSKDGLGLNLVMLEKMLDSVKSVRGVEKIYAGSFPSEIRPENATKKALLLLKKYSDNNNIIIGFQSGSDNVLKNMHRNHTAKEAMSAINRALEAGFKVNVDFIFGNPGETKEEEKETIEVIKELVKLPRVRIHGHTFLPLPGTPWQGEKSGKISDELRLILNELNASGRIYGDWEKQEKLVKD
ncbi:MAG: TIGR04013 family B12-binding domain/radical SAM domain-containing protein [Patescibacteria group bacterium]